MRSATPIHPLWCTCGCADPHRRRNLWRWLARWLASGPATLSRALLGLLLLAGVIAGLALIHFAPALAASLTERTLCHGPDC